MTVRQLAIKVAESRIQQVLAVSKIPTIRLSASERLVKRAFCLRSLTLTDDNVGEVAGRVREALK